MTICIAATGGKGQFVVVASDRMVTANPPPIEFEHNSPKITEISRTCAVLTAGDALANVELCSDAIDMTSAIHVVTTRQVAQQIQTAFTAQRSERIEALYLRPRGWTLQSFYQEHARSVPGDITFAVDRQIATYDHDLSVIIAGVDTSAHIYSVTNPGVLDCWDGIGCYSVGSGSSHAVSSFFLSNWTPEISLSALLFMTYEAKRRAEVAPGVGKQTDISYIDAVNGITHLDEDALKKLDGLYEQKNRPVSDSFIKEVESLFGTEGDNHVATPEGGGGAEERKGSKV